MKCPYRKETIIQPEIREGEKIRFERHTEEFCNCYQEECPFFVKYGNGEEGCRKAKREVGIHD